MLTSTAWGDLYVTTTTDVSFTGTVLDSSGLEVMPDSVRIIVKKIVTAGSYTEEYDAWFNAGDTEADSVEDEKSLTWGDAFGDIDDDEGVGTYQITAGFYAEGIYSRQHKMCILGSQDVNVASMDNSVLTAAAINSNAITTSKIADGAITIDDIATEVFSNIAIYSSDSVWAEGTRTLTWDLSNYDGATPLTKANVRDTIAVLFVDSLASIDSAEALMRAVAGDSNDVNVRSVTAGALESGDFEDAFLKATKIDADAFSAAKFAQDFWTALPESVIQDAYIDSAKFADDLFHAFKHQVWAETLDGVAEAASAEYWIRYLTNLFDGTSQIDSADMNDDFWMAVGNKAGAASDTTDIKAMLAGLYIDSTMALTIDSIIAKMGPFGDSSVTSTPFTLYYWMANVLKSVADSSLTILKVGNGPYLDSTYVHNDSGFIAGADVMFYQGATELETKTNSEGWAIFNLTSGTWYGLVYAVGNGQDTIPQTFSISANTTDSISMTAAAAGLCNVYNYVYDGGGNPVRGVTVTATIPTQFWPIRYQGKAIRATYSTTTDGNGKWELPLLPNSLLLTGLVPPDSSSHWLLTASDNVFGQGYKFTVPISSSVLMEPDSLQ